MGISGQGDSKLGNCLIGELSDWGIAWSVKCLVWELVSWGTVQTRNFQKYGTVSQGTAQEPIYFHANYDSLVTTDAFCCLILTEYYLV